MKNSSFTDFILCTAAIIVAIGVAVLAAMHMVEESTALVFLAISIACVGVSMLDVDMPMQSLKTRRSGKKSSKRRK